MKTLVWYRGKDLRVTDHAPLYEAAQGGGEVIPVFVLDPRWIAPDRAQRAPNRIQFMLECLQSLARNLEALGSGLVVKTGAPAEVISTLAERWNVDRVAAHRSIEPGTRALRSETNRLLGQRLHLYEGETLLPMGSVRTQDGHPYRVYSPFARRCRQLLEGPGPLPRPKRLPPLPVDPHDTDPIPAPADLGLEPNPRLLTGGEAAARRRLQDFLRDRVDRYEGDRDRMDVAGTSRLSADLKFGTLSVRAVWSAAVSRDANAGTAKFLSELLFREFAYHTLADQPDLRTRPFRSDFEGFPWRSADTSEFRAWATGQTGYPVVDAAARQLLEDGYVHNRARMVAASFLTKHLVVDYRAGEAHYLRYLTDGDRAQNNAGWQWSAGCGCDAQPYFRVFNPMAQGRKFDPGGDYVRRYVPELAHLPTKYIHAPFEAPAGILKQAGVALGETYPRPIIDHAVARERFLALAKDHLRRDAASPPAVAH